VERRRKKKRRRRGRKEEKAMGYDLPRGDSSKRISEVDFNRMSRSYASQ